MSSHTNLLIKPLFIFLAGGGIALLEACRLPAAWLLGPMLVSIGFAVSGRPVRFPAWAFTVAQALIGCMIARTLRVPVFLEMAHVWPVFVIGIGSVLLAATGLGWVMTRAQILPGTTALWGSSPGAASVMVLMAEAYGADMRLVAFMQYLRVVIVALVASIVPLIWMGSGQHHTTTPAPWLVLPTFQACAVTAVVVAIAYGAQALRLFPVAALLGAMALGAIIQDTGAGLLALPPWLLSGAYIVAGAAIGARFSPQIMRHALRALPRVLASIAALIVVCGVLAFGLVRFGGIDPLTAYLATSPGGADSVAIIAASAPVDVPFVMAMQVGRFLLVLALAPSIAKYLARRFPGHAA